MALAQAGDLEAKRVLLNVGFFSSDPQHLFCVEPNRPSARRGYLLCEFDYPRVGCCLF